jgi:CDP-glucose 4,6-dehydratase
VIASARAGNVIGGGDWAVDRLMPDVISSLQAGKTIRIRSPKSTRPWQHVLEPLSGYLTLALSGKGGAWNFGPNPGDVRTVEDTVKYSIVEWGRGEYAIEQGPNMMHESKALTLSSEKAQRQLGWRPRWEFIRAIHETVRWYKQPSADLWNLTISQIDQYERTL